MKTTLKYLAKNVVLSIPFAREKYFQRAFLKRSPSCKGAYESFAQALAHAPREKLLGYNHKSIPEFYKTRLDDLNPGDYPVLFWLLRLLPEVKFVFELGGSIGMGYYAYRRYVPLPADLRWVICETPETVETGREIARERKDTLLTFTEQRQVEGNPDIYATFGTLQYIEEPFAEIIGALARKPPHLLVGRVPFAEGAAYITLQNNGGWFSPYKVQNRCEFIKSIENLGYDLIDKWETIHPNSFLIHPEYQIPRYHGMYFRLK
jgi:putative methyltransferase (TIGR04325 family)